MTQLPQRDRQPFTLNFITLANLGPDLLYLHAILSLLVNLALRITSYPYPCISLDCGWKLEYSDRTYYLWKHAYTQKGPSQPGDSHPYWCEWGQLCNVKHLLLSSILPPCILSDGCLTYFGGFNEELFSKCLNSTRGIIKIMFLVWVDLKRSNK